MAGRKREAFLVSEGDDRRREQAAELRMILEMIDAAIDLSRRKGPHPLTPGCACIACVNRRKAALLGPDREWTYRL